MDRRHHNHQDERGSQRPSRHTSEEGRRSYSAQDEWRERRKNEEDYKRGEFKSHQSSERRRQRSRSPKFSRDDRRRDDYKTYENDGDRHTTRRPESTEPEIEIEKPNYTPSGLLARERNTYSESRGKTALDKLTASKVVLKYSEPADAAPFAPSLSRKETQYGRNTQYRLVCFEQGSSDVAESIRLDQLTFYLIGTDHRVAKIPLNESSRSDEQHAVLQYRLKVRTDKYGEVHRQIVPYIIDLESKRGTKLNGEIIPSLRFIELRNKDLLQFGKGTMEYVFLEEH